MSRVAVKHLVLFRLCVVSAAAIFSFNVYGRAMPDSYGEISFSPDGSRLLFTRCGEELGTCAIHQYEMASGKLSYYLPPRDQVWSDGRFSNDGRSIVFTLAPFVDEQRVLEKTQLATMRLDGSDLQILTSSSGIKGAPSFSADDHTILYASAAIRRKEGSTPATEFSVCEYDTRTKEEHLLTDVRFYQVSPPHYLNDAGDVVFSAIGPWKPSSRQAEKMLEKLGKLQLKNVMYRISSGKRDVSPWFMFGDGVFKPVVSRKNHRFFFASVASDTRRYEYFEFVKEGHYRQITHMGIDVIWSVDASPDGKQLAIVFSTTTGGNRDTQRKVGLVNTEDGSFTELDLTKQVVRIN